jgi:hypothetical protein
LLVGVFAVAAIVAVVLSIVAFNQQRIAAGEAKARATAESQALADRDRAVEAEKDALKQASIGLASQALAQMGTANSERGVLLALAALEEYPYTPQAETALARAVQESLPYKRMIDRKGFGLDGIWVDFSPDGKRIALGTTPNTAGEHSAVIFDLESGEIDLVLPITSVHDLGSVQEINWSPEGTKLALAINLNELTTLYKEIHHHYLQVYDGSSGELLLDLNSSGEFAVDWSPDGKRLLTGGEKGAVKIWDAHTGEVLLEMAFRNKAIGYLLPVSRQMENRQPLFLSEASSTSGIQPLGNC